MKYNSNLHSKSFIAKGILGKLESIFTSISKNRNDVLILNYHGIQDQFVSNFENQIEFLVQHFTPISPAEFEQQVDNKTINSISKPYLLITFDDGILNNLNALNILDKYNIKAYFFIVPDFVNSHSPKEFFIKNIRPIINPHIDNQPKDFTPLSWDQIREIKDKEHRIGSHTLTHTLTTEASNDELIKEIIESKKTLEKELNCVINSFCSINNTFLSVNKTAAKLIKENYKYHFTTIAGANIPLNNMAIRRVNVEAYWPENAFKYAIGKWELKRWKNKAIEVDQLMS